MLCDTNKPVSEAQYKLDRGQYTFAGDERDELADAFLHAFFGFFGYLRVVWQCCLHDSSDWCKVPDVSIKSGRVVRYISGLML